MCERLDFRLGRELICDAWLADVLIRSSGSSGPRSFYFLCAFPATSFRIVKPILRLNLDTPVGFFVSRETDLVTMSLSKLQVLSLD